jgi:putative endonuclease
MRRIEERGRAKTPAPNPRRVQRGQRAHRRGRMAESLCCWHLRLRGWRILARDWRCPAGEIDILARRGDVLAIIEVKSRDEVADAATALSPRQRRRIGRAAQVFLLARPDLAGLTLRFDMMLVARARLPRHWRNLWQLEG